MNKVDVIRFGLISALNAEVEGMKAENQNSLFNNYTIAYTDQDFVDKAEEIRDLVYSHDDQIS